MDSSGLEEEVKNEETAFVRKKESLYCNTHERVLAFCHSIPVCRKVSASSVVMLHRSWLMSCV